MTAEEAVLDLIRRWAEAEAANDAGRSDELFAPGFIGVGPVGFVLDRARWVERFENGLQNRSFRVEDPSVHLHGRTAFVVGAAVSEGSWQGRDTSGRLRVTLTAVESGEAWRIAGIHLGPLQPAPARG